jgi:hypothetical protein
MTLQEINDLRDVVKEHFSYAFVDLTDEDLIDEDFLKFNSFVYKTNYHNIMYDILKDDWISFKESDTSQVHHSFFDSEKSLLKSAGNCKFQYVITIDVPFKRSINLVNDELLINAINRLKLFIKQDELFKDWEFRIAKFNLRNNIHSFHIIILNTKDVYEFIPLQWKLLE